jgi:hypothetical protein
MSSDRHSRHIDETASAMTRNATGGRPSTRRFWSGASAGLGRLVLRGQLGPRSGRSRDQGPERMI